MSSAVRDISDYISASESSSFFGSDALHSE